MNKKKEIYYNWGNFPVFLINNPLFYMLRGNKIKPILYSNKISLIGEQFMDYSITYSDLFSRYEGVND